MDDFWSRIINPEVKVEGDKCSCSGALDPRWFIHRDPDIWVGKCFQCGQEYVTVQRQSDK